MNKVTELEREQEHFWGNLGLDQQAYYSCMGLSCLTLAYLFYPFSYYPWSLSRSFLSPFRFQLKYFPFGEFFPTTLLTAVSTFLTAKLPFVTLTSFIIFIAFRVIWNYFICVIACFLTRCQLQENRQLVCLFTHVTPVLSAVSAM